MTVVTLTGPTCAGKSHLERILQRDHGFGRAISHTTRKPRVGEVNGTHYHFVSIEEYDALKTAGEFIETIGFGDHRYAMSKAALEKGLTESVSGHVVIVVEPVGCAQILGYCKGQGIPTFSVWVDSPAEVLAQRLLKRMKDELRFCLTEPAEADVWKRYEERLALLLSTEVLWRVCASEGYIDRDATFRYDAFARPFNADTQGEIVAGLLKALQEQATI